MRQWLHSRIKNRPTSRRSPRPLQLIYRSYLRKAFINRYGQRKVYHCDYVRSVLIVGRTVSS